MSEIIPLSSLLDELPNDIDGLYTYRYFDNETNSLNWKFFIYTLSVNQFEKTDLGYKYYILHYGRNGEPNIKDFFTAVLIDSKHYVKSMIESGQDTLIIKVCEESTEILRNYFLQETLKLLQQNVLNHKGELEYE